jgi:N-acetylmuramoyl-L-alanine amidase
MATVLAKLLRLRKATVALICFLFCVVLIQKSNAEPDARFNTVVIDAGHGGFDRGGIPRQRVAEKTVALDVARRLQRALELDGYRTIMTRDSDVFVPLGTRVRIANRQRNAIFVCIHFNAARRSGASGIETYYYSRASASLGASIHRNVVAGTASENRGLRRRGYYVLRKTRIPAVLVECGFLTNPREAALAEIAGYRQTLAEQIARGIRHQPALAIRPTISSEVVSNSTVADSTDHQMEANALSVLQTADANAAVSPRRKSSTTKTSSSAHHSKTRSHKKTAHKSHEETSSGGTSSEEKQKEPNE